MPPSRFAQYLPLLIITLLAFSLRIPFAESRNATIDEISSLRWLGERSGSEILTQYHTNIHMLTSLLAYLIDRSGLITAGARWLAFYRAPALLLGTLTIPITFQLGRRLVNRPAGLLAALLLAIAPFHIDFSLQMRGYVPATFLAGLLYYALHRAFATDRFRDWATVGLSAALAVYAHLFAALAVGAGGLVLLAELIRRRQKRQPLPRPRSLIGLGTITTLGLITLYGPIWKRVLNTASVEQDWGSQIEPLWLDGAFNNAALIDYLKVLRLYGPIGEPKSWFVFSFVLLAGIGLLALLTNRYRPAKEGGRAGLFLALWLFGPLLAAATAMQIIPGFYLFWRFFMFIQPLYLLLMAVGMLALGQSIGRWAKRDWLSGVITAGLVIMALAGAGWKLYHQLREDTDNQWPQIAQTIRQTEGPLLVVCEVHGRQMNEAAAHKDECLRNLGFYLQPQLAGQVAWLAQAVDQVATIPGLIAHPTLEHQAGTVWLVLWQPDWPPPWPNLHQTEQLAGLTYTPIGSSLLIAATNRPTQLLALADSLTALTRLETTPQDRFSYLMSQAQMQAVIGRPEAARSAWLAGQALSPPGIDAENRLRAVAELIGMPELVAE